MEISNIGNEIKQSEARRLYDISKKYDDVIDLTIGDPDVPTPKSICDAGIKAINCGKTKYTANAGLIQLREAITNDIKKRGGCQFNPEDQIVVTTGAMGALYLLIKSIINPGDEVLIPEPSWINYTQMVLMTGGKVSMVPCDNNFSISIENIERMITGRTKAIIINSPCNPTGRIVDAGTLIKLIALCKSKNLFLIVDEAYSGIVFNKGKFKSIASLSEGCSNVILVDSFSKRFSMTGWRVGYAAGDSKIISAMTRLQENVNACCAEPSQYAAIEALKCDEEVVDNFVKIYKKRKDLLINRLKEIRGISYIEPEGTFYVFTDISKTGLSSMEFSYRLLEKVHVSVVPGTTYGKNGEGYVRIALTKSDNEIIEAANRIQKFMEG